VPAVIKSPIKRAVGGRNFDRGTDGKLMWVRWVLRREVHGVVGEVMGVLASSFWNEMSAEVLEVSEHFSL
jgi:hypothetical protein